MEQTLTEVAKSQGFYALLFVLLLLWVLKENKHREERYLQIIQTLSDEVKERLERLEHRFFKGGE